MRECHCHDCCDGYGHHDREISYIEALEKLLKRIDKLFVRKSDIQDLYDRVAALETSEPPGEPEDPDKGSEDDSMV